MRFLYSFCSILLIIITCGKLVYSRETECGVSSVDIPPYRIGNGTKVTQKGKYPWMAKIPNFCGGCTGTIIHSQYILTAAHCLCNVNGSLNDIEIVVGSNDIADETAVVVHGVYGTFHEGYKLETPPNASSPGQASARNDIGIIKLKEQLHFSDVIKPICLPKEFDEEQFRDVAIVAGFGYVDPPLPPRETTRLHEGKVKFTSSIRAECKSAYHKYNLTITEFEHLCYPQKGNAILRPGDSGGPLMYAANKNGKKQWKQIGIASFGDEVMPGMNLPFVQTLISSYCDWIRQKTEGNVKCEKSQIKL